MSSPKQKFSPEDLQLLDLALAGAMATAAELAAKHQALAGVLRRRLFYIASEGVTDPAMLRNKLVRSMNLDRNCQMEERAPVEADTPSHLRVA